MRGLTKILLGVLVAVLAAGVAGADSYYPLDVGSTWHYANANGQAEDASITGSFELLGVSTVVRHVEIYNTRIPPQVVENFWTLTSDGDLLLHGAHNITDTLELAYWPPVVMIDAPLWLGKSWVTEEIHVYRFDGSPGPFSPFDYPLAVHFEGEVAVPAGSFQCFGVGFDLSTPVLRLDCGRAYDIYGRRLSAGAACRSGDATEWYAEGVGLVQNSYLTDPGELMKLVSWEPTAVEATSWGRVKALFR